MVNHIIRNLPPRGKLLFLRKPLIINIFKIYEYFYTVSQLFLYCLPCVKYFVFINSEHGNVMRTKLLIVKKYYLNTVVGVSCLSL